jgi:hypothetical protein
MKSEQEQIEKMKITLSEAMRRVPQSIVEGSYQIAVQYKKNYAKAEKIRKKQTPTFNELNWAIRAMTGLDIA